MIDKYLFIYPYTVKLKWYFIFSLSTSLSVNFLPRIFPSLEQCQLYLQCLHTRKTLRNNSFKSGIFQNSYDLIFISVLEKSIRKENIERIRN